MEEATREILNLFVEKAYKLKSRKFAHYLLNGENIGIHFSPTENEDIAIIAYTGPDEEAIEAFLLTFRFFIQDGDRISFRYLNNKIYYDPNLSERWKKEFKLAYEVLTQYLNQHSKLLIAIESSPTRNEILKVFIYGDLAHADNNKKEGSNHTLRRKFEIWKEDRWFYHFYRIEFIYILCNVFSAIISIAELSEQELRKNGCDS